MIELLQCDCLEYMREIPDKHFELAIVDPPYRDAKENDMNENSRKYIKSGRLKDWNDKPNESYFNELNRISANQIIWGANNFHLCFKGFVIWEKDIPEDFTMSMCEIASLSEGLSTISKIIKIRAAGATQNRIHPTEKPVKLYKWLLKNYAKDGDKILDTHLGSGSIAIACHDLKFDLVGCEIDKDYYDAAVKRFEDHKKQLSLF